MTCFNSFRGKIATPVFTSCCPFYLVFHVWISANSLAGANQLLYAKGIPSHGKTKTHEMRIKKTKTACWCSGGWECNMYKYIYINITGFLSSEAGRNHYFSHFSLLCPLDKNPFLRWRRFETRHQPKPDHVPFYMYVAAISQRNLCQLGRNLVPFRQSIWKGKA